jgi:diguanylate cyclase (GGDEF)-like protein
MHPVPGDYLTDASRDPLAPPTRRELFGMACVLAAAAALLTLGERVAPESGCRWLGAFIVLCVATGAALGVLAALVRRRLGANPTSSSLVLLLLVFVGGLGPPFVALGGIALDTYGGDDVFGGRRGFVWAALAVLGPALELAWRHWHVNSLRRHAPGDADEAADAARERAELEHIAFHDALTGLPNRRHFERALQQCAGTGGADYAVMFLDFDKFKLINDTHGHAVGDAFLVSVAQRLRELLRHSDLAARLGGDEFAVLVRGDAVSEAALAMAERIGQAMARPFELGTVELRSSASIGIAVGGGAVADVDAVVQAADLAMYRAKKAGGAGFALAGTDAAQTTDESGVDADGVGKDAVRPV